MVYLSVAVNDFCGDLFFLLVPSLLMRQMYGAWPEGVPGSHHAFK
jgi:hypothetical protein